VEVRHLRAFEAQFIPYLHARAQGLRNAIALQRELSPELEQMLAETIAEFKRHHFVYE